MTLYYMLQRIDDGAWLPQYRGAATTQEFTREKPPRLFSTMSAARRSLNWWRKGVTYTELVRTGNFMGEDDYLKIKRDEIPERLTHYYAIVPVEVASVGDRPAKSD